MQCHPYTRRAPSQKDEKCDIAAAKSPSNSSYYLACRPQYSNYWHVIRKISMKEKPKRPIRRDSPVLTSKCNIVKVFLIVQTSYLTFLPSLSLSTSVSVNLCLHCICICVWAASVFVFQLHLYLCLSCICICVSIASLFVFPLDFICVWVASVFVFELHLYLCFNCIWISLFATSVSLPYYKCLRSRVVIREALL